MTNLLRFLIARALDVADFFAEAKMRRLDETIKQRSQGVEQAKGEKESP